ncbi:Mss18 [Kluyveromyces lactis]|nr:Mss18 [Kluyveromyces lactis]
MRTAHLQRIIREDTIFCRLFLRLSQAKRIDASLAIDKLLADISRFGDVLYEKPNEKFIKPTALPLKLDLAICSPDKVKLAKLITNIRGYVVDPETEPDYSKLTTPIASEEKPDLKKTLDILYANTGRRYPNQLLSIPNEPFVFLNNPVRYYRTLSGKVKDIHRRDLFKWVFLEDTERLKTPEGNFTGEHSYSKRFIEFPSNKPAIQIIPCLFQNLTELPNEMNNWLRLPDKEFKESTKSRISTLFHGFSGL